MARDNGSNTSVYKHGQNPYSVPMSVWKRNSQIRKLQRLYRYDSSLAPEMSWNESAERAFAEWLLALVADAAEKGERRSSRKPQVWQGNGESFRLAVAMRRPASQPRPNPS